MAELEKVIKETKLARKRWEKIVNMVLRSDNESKAVKDARKQLFIGLFDDYAREKNNEIMKG